MGELESVEYIPHACMRMNKEGTMAVKYDDLSVMFECGSAPSATNSINISSVQTPQHI